MSSFLKCCNIFLAYDYSIDRSKRRRSKSKGIFILFNLFWCIFGVYLDKITLSWCLNESVLYLFEVFRLFAVLLLQLHRKIGVVTISICKTFSFSIKLKEVSILYGPFHNDLKVVNENGEVVPFGSPGELLLRGYNVMIGYWDDPVKTKQTLSEDGWLRTGYEFSSFKSIIIILKSIIIMMNDIYKHSR